MHRNRIDLGRLANLAEQLRERTTPPAARRGSRSWYRIDNAASGEVTDVYLYDMIGEWGITAQDFVAELRQVTGPINLHVSCEGGEVFDGVAIYTALARHSAPVTAYVDSLAASAASFVVQAAGHRVMARNARMMIHDAHGLCIGNATDMQAMAVLLGDLSDNIASIYADRAGGTVQDWRARMQAGVDGTWYTGQAAVDVGLADEVAAAGSGSAAALWDPAPADPAPDPPPVAWDPGAFLQAIREVENPPPGMPDVLPWQTAPTT